MPEARKRCPFLASFGSPYRPHTEYPPQGASKNTDNKSSFYRIYCMGKSTLLNKNWTWKMRWEYIIVYGNNIVVPLQHLPVLIFHFLYHCFFLKINIKGISRTETGRMYIAFLNMNYSKTKKRCHVRRINISLLWSNNNNSTGFTCMTIWVTVLQKLQDRKQFNILKMIQCNDYNSQSSVISMIW